MKASQFRYGRVIDFEGTRKNGIQQASIIDFSDFKIVRSSEYLKSDDKFNEWINTDSHLSHIDYWVAHNINVEKSIIRYFSRQLGFDPEDTQAIRVIDLRRAFEFFQWFFTSINLFLGFSGLLTLAVGGISVANMMFLIVTERTPEIGLKLAL